MSSRDLAPVLIVTYSRLEHLRKTISSLRGNILADQTDLFVASDQARTEADAEKVAAVRDYLKSIDGFGSVTVFERDKNLGAAESTFSALEVILAKYDRFILMEDDIVTAPGYLSFVNEAFRLYGGNGGVFSIAGYCPPISIPRSYKYDAFFLGRMNAWGCALTKERYLSVPRQITREEYSAIADSKELSLALAKGGGKDVLEMLKLVASGSLDAWDVRCMYTQFMKHQMTVYPTQSLIQNIGFDGSGVHCGKTDRFDVNLSGKISFRFPEKIDVDRRIVREYLKFRDGRNEQGWLKPWAAKIAGKVRRIIKQLFR